MNIASDVAQLLQTRAWVENGQLLFDHLVELACIVVVGTALRVVPEAQNEVTITESIAVVCQAHMWHARLPKEHPKPFVPLESSELHAHTNLAELSGNGLSNLLVNARQATPSLEPKLNIKTVLITRIGQQPLGKVRIVWGWLQARVIP